MGVRRFFANSESYVYNTEFVAEYIGYDTISSDPKFGTYLVRATVPVPAAVWLFGSALAGLGWMSRRQLA